MVLKKLTTIINKKSGAVGTTAKCESRASERGVDIARTGGHIVIRVATKGSTVSGCTSTSSKGVKRNPHVRASEGVPLSRVGKLVVKGCGSVFNLGKSVYSRRADAVLRKTGGESLCGDWRRVGDDMRKAMSAYAKGKP